MATKNTTTPSGGIFQSHRGGQLGFGISPMTIQQQAMTIQQQIIQDAQKRAEERWKILREQSKIFEIQQDITAHKARTGDIARSAWEQYIRQ